MPSIEEMESMNVAKHGPLLVSAAGVLSLLFDDGLPHKEHKLERFSNAETNATAEELSGR